MKLIRLLSFRRAFYLWEVGELVGSLAGAGKRPGDLFRVDSVEVKGQGKKGMGEVRGQAGKQPGWALPSAPMT